jgi:ribosomal protein L19
MNNVLKEIKDQIISREDKCKLCCVGHVYTLVYTNAENNNKYREFSGLCIRRQNKLGETFITLRNVVADVGVEFSLGGRSLMLIKVNDTNVYKGKYTKSKLYYLRLKGITASRVRLT